MILVFPAAEVEETVLHTFSQVQFFRFKRRWKQSLLVPVNKSSGLTWTTARTSGREFCVGGTGGRRQKR